MTIAYVLKAEIANNRTENLGIIVKFRWESLKYVGISLDTRINLAYFELVGNRLTFSL